VLEWVQTSSGIGSYTIPSFPVDIVVPVSSAQITNGRIVLADESLLAQTISISANTRSPVPSTFTPPILEISGTRFSGAFMGFSTYAFGMESSNGAIPSVSCPYFRESSTNPALGFIACEASINLVRDASEPNRFYGSVSTASGIRPSTDETRSTLRSGSPSQAGAIVYMQPVLAGYTQVSVPIGGYWQLASAPTNVPLPSAFLLMVTGLSLLAVARRRVCL
jgi:hypothetical protein